MTLCWTLRARTCRASLAAALLVATSGCASGDWQPISVSQANAELESAHLLAQGDSLRITVFDEPSLTGEFVVGDNGQVAFPLLEAVAAEGQTTQALAAAITRDLSGGGYVLNPRVTVEVTSYRPVYVLGEVREPGEYDYVEQLSALQAIAKAGGFTPLANQRRVVLFRSGWQERRVVELREIPLMIAPGDTLLVTQSAF